MDIRTKRLTNKKNFDIIGVLKNKDMLQLKIESSVINLNGEQNNLNNFNQQGNNENSINQALSNQNFNKNTSRKINLGLIIGVIVIIILSCIIIIGYNVYKNNSDEEKNFLLRIDDVFSIIGRGTIVTGIVERGTVKLNDEVYIIGMDKEIIATVVTNIEAFRKKLDSATVGDNIGITLKNVEKEQLQAGQVVAHSNSIVTTKKFDAELSFVSTEDAVVEKSFTDILYLQFYFGTDIDGKINLLEGIEIVNPSDNVTATINLKNSIAMDIGTKFDVKENGKIIANGVVTRVY